MFTRSAESLALFFRVSFPKHYKFKDNTFCVYLSHLESFVSMTSLCEHCFNTITYLIGFLFPLIPKMEHLLCRINQIEKGHFFDGQNK